MADRERELLLRAAPIVLRAMTPRWHLAQIVGHEGLGVCSWKRCSDGCTAARRLLLDLGEYLDDTAPQAPQQIGLFDVEGGG